MPNATGTRENNDYERIAAFERIVDQPGTRPRRNRRDWAGVVTLELQANTAASLVIGVNSSGAGMSALGESKQGGVAMTFSRFDIFSPHRAVWTAELRFDAPSRRKVKVKLATDCYNTPCCSHPAKPTQPREYWLETS